MSLLADFFYMYCRKLPGAVSVESTEKNTLELMKEVIGVGKFITVFGGLSRQNRAVSYKVICPIPT